MRPNRRVVAERKITGVADMDVRRLGMMEQAPVHVKVARPVDVRYPVAAIFKRREPDEPIQRVEVLQADAGYRASQEPAPHHDRLRDSFAPFCARFNTEPDVAKYHVAELVVCRESFPMRHRRARHPRAVERQPTDLTIQPSIVEHHPASDTVPTN